MPAAPFRPVAGRESRHVPLAGLLLAAVFAAGCGETATLPAEAGYGDGELVELVALVALNVLTNYLNEVAQTDIDFPVPAEPAAA